MKRALLFLFTWICLASVAIGQSSFLPAILKDASAVKEVEKTLHYIYNMEPEKAEEGITKLAIKGYDKHPAIYLLKSLNNYWALYPLKQKPKAREAYMQSLTACYEAAKPMLARNPNEPEAIFFSAISQMMLASMNGELGNSVSAMHHARLAYNWVKEIKDKQSKNADFALVSGLYDYYREWYPEQNNAYKAVTFFFMSGNKETGLASLELAADKGILTCTNAKTFLVSINLHHEHKPEQSAKYAASLIEEFPNNWVFQNLACDVFMQAKQFDKALEVLEKIKLGDCAFKSLIVWNYYGQLQEYKLHDMEKASLHYNRAAELLALSTGIPNFVKASIYAGQARCAVSSGNNSTAAGLYKTVKKLAGYSYLALEAERFLDDNN